MEAIIQPANVGLGCQQGGMDALSPLLPFWFFGHTLVVGGEICALRIYYASTLHSKSQMFFEQPSFFFPTNSTSAVMIAQLIPQAANRVTHISFL